MSDTAPSRSAGARSRAGRPDQLTVLGFATDPVSEIVLRDGLADLAQNGVPHTFDIRRGTVKAAIAAMARMAAPRILVVDIGSDDRPLHALLDLCDVIEPSVAVLVIGDIDDVDLYRAISRRIGAVDYLFKPITREMVARYFASLITNNRSSTDMPRGGRVISVTGARGGVGASTIAASLAWFFGVEANRHTLLLDADPFVGTSHDRFDVRNDPSLQDLLQTPTFDSAATVLDAVQPVEGRLCVLGSPPDPTCDPDAVPGAARWIIDAVRMRFNFVVLDLPFLPLQQHRELLELTHHRIVVLEPSVAGLRDALRFVALPNGPDQPHRPTVCLTREGMPGGLRRKHIEDAFKHKVDFVLPDMPRVFAGLATQTFFGGAPKGPLSRLVQDIAREAGFEPGRKAA